MTYFNDSRSPRARLSRPRSSDSAFLNRAPVRAVIINEDVDPARDQTLDLPRAMEFFFNPQSMRFSAKTKWAQISVPGLSHEVLQWSNGESSSLRFTLEWSFLDTLRRQESRTFFERTPYQSIRDASLSNGLLYKDFLYALTIPVERGHAPSRATVLWPGTLQFTGVVTGVEFTFDKFASNGALMSFSAQVSMTEARTIFRQRTGSVKLFEASDRADANVTEETSNQVNTSPELSVPETPENT